MEVEGGGAPPKLTGPLQHLHQNSTATQLRSNTQQETAAAAAVVKEELDVDTETEGGRHILPLFIQTSGLVTNVSVFCLLSVAAVCSSWHCLGCWPMIS